MDAVDALNKLCKWRSVLTGWIMGTALKSEPGVQGIRDLMDARLIVRAEVSALLQLCMRKGLFTAQEWAEQLHDEAVALDQMYEKKFAGYRTELDGVHIDPAVAMKTNARLGFPP
jgi:hypothetical protein